MGQVRVRFNEECGVKDVGSKELSTMDGIHRENEPRVKGKRKMKEQVLRRIIKDGLCLNGKKHRSNEKHGIVKKKKESDCKRGVRLMRNMVKKIRGGEGNRKDR